MSRLDPQTAWRRLVLDSRLPARVRVAALNQLARPSVNMLRTLLSAKSTPPKLRILACEKYQIAMTRKELNDRAKQRPQ
jgi:hypothetical protein